MPAIVRVEDLLRIPQLTTGALMYASQSGIPYSTTILDIINIANNNSGIFATLQQLQNVSGIFNNSGQLLELQINSLSGYSNNIFSTINNLLLTGQATYNLITGLSGKLNQTGSNLQVQITNIINGETSLSTGVTSLNLLTGGITLVQKGGITITTVGQTINISGANLAGNNPPSVVFTNNIDWSTSNTFSGINTNSTLNLSFSNPSDGQTISVLFNNVSSGLINWPAITKWPNSVIPVPVSGNTDIYTFININGNIYSTAIQNFPS